jgi:FAD/FMN-containing dehydrogenase
MAKAAKKTASTSRKSARKTKAAPRPGLSLPDLRAAIHGHVIGPDDAGYDHSRTVFYAGFDRRPAAIIRVADAAALSQGPPAAYVNFLSLEGPDRVRAAYPGATWERLAAIKQRYDPENLFRLNQNIPPAAAPMA